MNRYVAGTPIIVVTRFDSISDRARPASNDGSRTTVAPFHHARRGCTFHPPMWYWGSTWSTTSNVVTSMRWSIERFVQKQLAWVSTAPFGRPLVPDV